MLFFHNDYLNAERVWGVNLNLSQSRGFHTQHHIFVWLIVGCLTSMPSLTVLKVRQIRLYNAIFKPVLFMSLKVGNM